MGSTERLAFARNSIRDEKVSLGNTADYVLPQGKTPTGCMKWPHAWRVFDRSPPDVISSSNKYVRGGGMPREETFRDGDTWTSTTSLMCQRGGTYPRLGERKDSHRGCLLGWEQLSSPRYGQGIRRSGRLDPRETNRYGFEKNSRMAGIPAQKIQTLGSISRDTGNGNEGNALSNLTKRMILGGIWWLLRGFRRQVNAANAGRRPPNESKKKTGRKTRWAQELRGEPRQRHF